MRDWTPEAPDRRWQPFADALWSQLRGWRPRCQAALDFVDAQLDDLVGPCELGCLLEEAVPLRDDGWRDPLAPDLLRFTEWVCECPWPEDEDDWGSLSCFVGSCVVDGLSASPDMAKVFLPYLGPKLANGLRADIELPRRRRLWPDGLPSTSQVGAKFRPLELARRPLLLDG